MQCTDPELAGDSPPFCYVHGHPLPCPLPNGPAHTEPIHVTPQEDMTEAVETVRRMVRGSRPIIVHAGREDGHFAEMGQHCWCDSYTIPPS